MESKSKKLLVVLLCIALAMTFSFTGSVFAEEESPTSGSAAAVEGATATGNDQGQVGTSDEKTDEKNVVATKEKTDGAGEKEKETPKTGENEVNTSDVSKLTKVLDSINPKKKAMLQAAKYYGWLVERNPKSQEDVDEAIAIVSSAVKGYADLKKLNIDAARLITENTPELKNLVKSVDDFLNTKSAGNLTSAEKNRDKLKEVAIEVNARTSSLIESLNQEVEALKKEEEASKEQTDKEEDVRKEQIEQDKKDLPENLKYEVGIVEIPNPADVKNPIQKAVFTLNYTIGENYRNQEFTFDPYSDFFRVARIYGLENWDKAVSNRVYQYYPAMPGDRNYVTIKITNNSGKKFYYKGGFGLSIAGEGTVVPEDGTDFYDLVSLAFSEEEITEGDLISSNSIIPSLTVNSYKEGGSNVPGTVDLLQKVFGKDSNTSTWAENGCTIFSGFALDGSGITNPNALKSFGWSTPITLTRDADPIPVPTKTIRVSKVWVTDDGRTPAESVDVQILKNGEAYKVVTLSDANGWNYSEAVIDDGAKYTAQEVTSVDGFVSSVTEDGDTITITNDDVKKPDKPVKPDKPTKPDKPVKPTKPDKPVKPNKPAKPKKPAVSVSVEQVKANVPKTGDENHMGLYGGMLVLAAAGAAVLLRLRRKSGK